MKKKKNNLLNCFFRNMYFVAGILMTFFAIIAILLPIIPTTPFLMIATLCFSRSSPTFNTWINSNPFFLRFLAKWKNKKFIKNNKKLILILSVIVLIIFYYFLFQKIRFSF